MPLPAPGTQAVQNVLNQPDSLANLDGVSIQEVGDLLSMFLPNL